MRKIISLPFLFSFCFAFAQNEIKIYPANWWVGMKDPHLQILIRGKNVGKGTLLFSNKDNPGITFDSIQKIKNPNYLFLHVTIVPNAKPGKLRFDIDLSGTHNAMELPLEKRPSGIGKTYARGINSSDFIYLLMPDRFSNGDSHNDHYANMRWLGRSRRTIGSCRTHPGERGAAGRGRRARAPAGRRCGWLRCGPRCADRRPLRTRAGASGASGGRRRARRAAGHQRGGRGRPRRHERQRRREEAALADAQRAAAAAEAALAEAGPGGRHPGRHRRASADAPRRRRRGLHQRRDLRRGQRRAPDRGHRRSRAAPLARRPADGPAPARCSPELARSPRSSASPAPRPRRAAAAAAQHQAEVDPAPRRGQAARDQQAAVAADVDARIESALAESAALESLDADLARRSPPSRPPSPPATGRGRGSGGAAVAAARVVGNGRSRRSAGSRWPARSPTSSSRCSTRPPADGITLGGGGYRSSDSQWRLRERLPSSDAANSSPSSCRPPTARPGQSMHEQGLAIDFTYGGRVISSRSSPPSSGSPPTPAPTGSRTSRPSPGTGRSTGE